MEVSVSSDTCPIADEGMTSANTNPTLTQCELSHVAPPTGVYFNRRFDYLTNSISLGRHSLVKNGSSGL